MVLNEVGRGRLGGRQAAEVLNLSLRQSRRLIVAYRKEGAQALAHGNRGRKPPNAIEEELRQQVLELASCKYSGFNHQHFTELLAEREDIFLSRSSVRNILLESGIRSPERDDHQSIAVGGSVIPGKVCFCRLMVVLMTG